MKKKIINGFLAVALLFGATSSFVSCKDYDEENLIPVIDKLTALDKALDQQNASLQAQIDALKTAQAACRNRCDSIVRVISAYDWNKYLTKDEAAALYLQLGGYQGTAKDLDDAIKALQNRLNATNGKTYEEWVAQIDENNRAIANAKAVADRALALAQQDSTLIAGLDGRVGTLEDQMVTVNGNITTLTDLLNATKHRLDSIEIAWSTKWQEAYDNAAYAKDKANTNYDLIVGLQHVVDSLKGLDHTPGTSYNDSALRAKIDSIVLSLSDYATKQQLIDSLAAQRDYADSLFAQVNEKADSALALAIRDSIEIKALGGRVADVESKYATLEGKIATLSTDVAVLKTKVDEFNRRITRLEVDLPNLITDIKIENTASSFGYLATPFGVNLQILGGYYGKGVQGVEFPTKQSKFYMDAKQNFTDAELAILGEDIFAQITKGANEGFVAEVDGSEIGNAGDIYFTVNPSNVDATALPVALVNTKDEESPIKIGSVERADTVLTHGYTTRADNGFYVGKATLSVDQINDAKLNADIDLETVKDAVKDAWKNRSKSSVITAATTIFNEVAGIESLPKYGLRTQWTDQTNGQLHKLYSNYPVLATAINPLSFNTLRDVTFTVTMFDRAEELANNLIDRINLNINLGLPDFSKYQGAITFEDVKITDFTNTSVSFTLNYTLVDGDGNVIYLLVTDGAGSYFWKAGDGTLYDATTGNLITTNVGVTATTITIDKTENVDLTPVLNDIIAQLNNQFGENSDLAKNITSLLNDVSSLDNLDINGTVDGVKSKMKSAVSRLVEAMTSRMEYALNNINNALQPVLLVAQGGKISRASGIKSNPTAGSGEVILIPTSYNLEILAPAYKKFVAVANVFDATGAQVSNAKELADAANAKGDMKTVIDGDKAVKLVGQKGYTYEVIYSAVDFHGVVVNRRYYVKF